LRFHSAFLHPAPKVAGVLEELDCAFLKPIELDLAHPLAAEKRLHLHVPVAAFRHRHRASFVEPV
jgi:hypothetical protein